MFELDWAKLLIIMLVAIVVVGPKELPGLLRTLGRTLAVLRRHAEQFRLQFEESLQELTKDVGVDDIKEDLRKLNELNPANQIRNSLDQAMRGVPAPQAYLRGEPAPGTAMTAFEEPQTPPQPEAAPQHPEAQPATATQESAPAPHNGASPSPAGHPPAGSGESVENKEKKETLESAAIH